MLNHDCALEVARRQAAQARARVESQQFIVASMARQGLGAVRARRVLGELQLAAELLQDRVAHLENCAPVFSLEAPARAERGLQKREVAPG